ncbi:MAG TPA: MFS transporter [Ignavibacteriaceae bacterium]|nr:MFS transporter [Ignavibacteriaceae bacterium]
MSFITVNTILPVLIERIGGNAIAVGSVTVLWTLGLNLPQLFFIRFFPHKGKVKPDVLRYGLIFRLNFIIISLVCSLFIGNLDSSISVPLMLFLIFIAAITGSSSGLFWYDFFSRTTPVKLRGRLLSIRLLLGSALGMLGGSTVAIILSSVVFPHNFALLFLIAFLLSMVSFFILTRLKESTEEIPVKNRTEVIPPSFKETFRRSKKILKENSDFKNFMIADALILMALTASAFYAVYAIRKFNLPSAYAGTFTIILMASQVFGNFIFGYLADFFGHKINIIILAASSAAASICAAFANNVLLYGVVFFFVGCTITLQGISRLAIVVEMCNESERPIYIGLLNTITAPTVLFGIIGGLLITFFGYVPVFIVYAVISLTAVYWLYKKVNEPRKLKTVDILN